MGQADGIQREGGAAKEKHDDEESGGAFKAQDNRRQGDKTRSTAQCGDHQPTIY